MRCATIRSWLILAFAIVLANARADNHDEARVAALYRRALHGEKGAVEQCISELEGILKAEPQKQLARVYLGSCYTLRSRDMGFGPSKLRTLNEGIRVMDEAVAAAPEDAQVRLVRARTCDALPSFLGHRKTARDDFAWLAREAQIRPDKFSDADLAEIRRHAVN